MALTNFPQGLSSFGFPLIGSGPVMGLGSVWFVSSAIGSDAHGYGTDNKRPFKTIAYACSIAGADDVIIVAPTHTESVIAASGWVPPAGVQIIGLGVGLRRPTITLSTATAAQITVTNAGVRFSNLVFDMTGIDAVAAGIAITGTDFLCDSCYVIQAISARQATKAFLVGAARATFIDLHVDASGGAGAASAIESSAAISGLRIYGGRIRGDFSVSPLVSAGANIITNMLVDNVTLYQSNGTAKAVVTFTTSDTGQVRNCTFIGTTWASAADAIGGGTNVALRWTQNFGFDDGAGAVSGVLVPAVGTIA